MTVYALIDCNNFFVSCERVFNPKLENKPVIILSSNDGCVIARSNESKKLGIVMGEPYFKIKEQYAKYKIEALSSNHYLYTDMSRRVMSVIMEFFPNIDIYSIDEAFVKLDLVEPGEVMIMMREMRNRIRRWTGIPVAIGVANSKTLAKIASEYAKKEVFGVYDLRSQVKRDLILDHTPLIDIWGIGKNLSEKLKAGGFGNAGELRVADSKMIRKNYGINLERTLMELRGVDCHEQEVTQSKQNIMSSRSFGRNVVKLEELEEAVANYAVKACRKMSEQNMLASGIYVLLVCRNTNNKNTYLTSQSYWFDMPSDNIMQIVKTAKMLVGQIYIDGEIYRKAGVVLLNLQTPTQCQNTIFNLESVQQNDKLVRVINSINRNMGENTLFLAAQGTKRDWYTKSGYRSGRYTTNLAELPIVK